MAQSFSTTIGLAANASSDGQAVDFDGQYARSVTIANNSGISIQYTLSGTGWVSVANGTSVTLPDASPALFRLRKGTSDSYPVPVGMTWLTSSDQTDGTVAQAVANARVSRIAAFAKGPAVVAPAIAGSATPYAVDQVVRLSNGVHLACTAAGTSSGTAPVPSATVTDGRPITDGSVTWYMNGTTKTASDADAPTVSSAASAAAAGLTASFFCSGSSPPVNVRVRGAQPVNVANTYVGCFTFASGATAMGGNATGLANTAGYSGDSFTTSLYEYETDVIDHKFGVIFHNGVQRVLIEVDDQPLVADLPAPSGSSGNVVVFDYSGSIKKRRVKVVVLAGISQNVRGIALTSQGSLLQPEASTDTLMVFGDSFFDTAPPGTQACGHLGHFLKRALGVQEIVLCNVGGTGYIAAQTANSYNLPSVITNANNRVLFSLYNPSHILINAGLNDSGSSVAAIKAAALTTWQAARSQFPSAKITIGDSWSAATGPNATMLAIASGLADQFAVWGDANARFITPVSTSASTAYIQGTTNAGQALGAGSSGIYTSTDGTHPSPAGARYLATRLAGAINAAWRGGY
jgi:lysophospholipase L1-like esterase